MTVKESNTSSTPRELHLEKLRPKVPRPVEPTLFVQENSGDFAEWVQKKTIETPEDSLFSFQNDLTNVTGTQWQIATKPMPVGPTAGRFTGYLGSGSFQPPEQGKAGLFSADWKSLVPENPTLGTKYYIRVVAEQGATKTPVVASNTVVITIDRSDEMTEFTPEGLGQTVKQQSPALYATPSMAVELDLQDLYIGNDNEDDDEPYLIAAVVYVDGTTIDPLDMASSTVRIDSPAKTHGNVPDEDEHGDGLEEASTAVIPGATGHFEKTITPIGLALAADLADPQGELGAAIGDATAIYVMVVAMEEDGTSTAAANAARSALVKALRKEIESVIQGTTLAELIGGTTPTFDANKLNEMEKELKKQAFAAAEDESLFPLWWTPAMAPLLLDDLDRDDYVGWGVRKFSYGDLLASGPDGIHFEIECSNNSDWEGSYTIRGRIRRK